MVNMVMESSATLMAEIVTDLLRACKNIKVKRLFLWFAEKHRHHWFEKLDLKDIDLGKGKRVIQKGGMLDKKYLITVPRERDDSEEQPIF
jgi:hypothetical protein